MISAVYECEVVHQRLAPQKHGFRYRLFFLDLFLDELPWLEAELLCFRHNRWSLYSFFDRDHLPLGKPSLRENLAAWLSARGLDLAETDRVRFISLPRVLGYIFNPASFYFVYDAAGRVKHCVVQVTNTFHEIKAWLVPPTEHPGYFQLQTPKDFYVSPFSRVDTVFDYRITVPCAEMKLHIDTLDHGQRTLVSWIKGERRELTSVRLLQLFFSYPLMTVAVIFRIHWHAFRLWMKGLPFSRKSDQPERQSELYRPHTSLLQTPT